VPDGHDLDAAVFVENPVVDVVVDAGKQELA